MSQLELRPLSLGEILDRTFVLYRAHFVLFVALAAIPRLPSFAFALFQAGVLGTTPVGTASTMGMVFIAGVVGVIGYLVSQGGGRSCRLRTIPWSSDRHRRGSEACFG